jgi:hypothetical protein
MGMCDCGGLHDDNEVRPGDSLSTAAAAADVWCALVNVW